MQKQPTIIVRVITDDYIKVSGNAITDTVEFSIELVFRGWNARTIAIEWIEANRERVRSGELETRIIVKGDLTGRSAERCALTQALYGTFS